MNKKKDNELNAYNESATRFDDSTAHFDELMHEAAAQKTQEVPLDELLRAVYARRTARESAPAPRLRARLAFALAAAVALTALVAMPALAQRVVIDGRGYIAFGDEVRLSGEVYDISEQQERGALVRLQSTNEYVSVTATESASPGIFVYPIGECPAEPKNPDAVSGGDSPASLPPAYVYPVVGDLSVREGPGTEHAILATLHSGQCVKKVGIWGDWAIVQWGGGVAYAYNAYLFDVPEFIVATGSVAMRATERVNVRALPTSRDESEALYELMAGQQVECTGEIGAWLRIRWEDGSAYVFKKYLEEKGGNEN